MKRIVLPIATALFAAAPVRAAVPPARALLLADGLMDRAAVCAAYLQTQKPELARIVRSWRIERADAAEERLYREMAPTLTSMCNESVSAARLDLASILAARLSPAELLEVYTFLSSSAGRKFVAGASAATIRTTIGGDPEPHFSLTPEERALGSRTFRSPAWHKYKAVGDANTDLFGKAQVHASEAHAREMHAIVERVRLSIVSEK